MAEERNVGIARATETHSETHSEADSETTKAELQRRMEEARESITQTVTEIKDTVTNQYQHVRESISESLDWREQFRRRPTAFSVGAVGLGLILGYRVGGALAARPASDDSFLDIDYADEDEYYTADSDGVTLGSGTGRSYAGQAITGASMRYAPTDETSRPSHLQTSTGFSPAFSARQPSHDTQYDSVESDSIETDSIGTGEDKPGIFERFRETKAYDRLQSELSTLGERFVEELSTTARTVVLPALLGKVKDMIGIDLSTQREVAQRSQLERQATKERVNTTATEESQKTQY